MLESKKTKNKIERLERVVGEHAERFNELENKTDDRYNCLLESHTELTKRFNKLLEIFESCFRL